MGKVNLTKVFTSIEEIEIWLANIKEHYSVQAVNAHADLLIDSITVNVLGEKIDLKESPSSLMRNFEHGLYSVQSIQKNFRVKREDINESCN